MLQALFAMMDFRFQQLPCPPSLLIHPSITVRLYENSTPSVVVRVTECIHSATFQAGKIIQLHNIFERNSDIFETDLSVKNKEKKNKTKTVNLAVTGFTINTLPTRKRRPNNNKTSCPHHALVIQHCIILFCVIVMQESIEYFVVITGFDRKPAYSTIGSEICSLIMTFNYKLM